MYVENNNNHRGDMKTQCKEFWFGLVLNENRKKKSYSHKKYILKNKYV